MLGKLKQCLKKHRGRKKGYLYSLVEIKGKRILLKKLDGHKIISYWYDDFCRFLKDMAKYIEGLIIFEFETMAEGPAYVCFEDGKVKIHLPVWHELTPDDLIRARRERKRELNKQYKSETRARVPKKTGNESVGRRRTDAQDAGDSFLKVL